MTTTPEETKIIEHFHADIMMLHRTKYPFLFVAISVFDPDTEISAVLSCGSIDAKIVRQLLLDGLQFCQGSADVEHRIDKETGKQIITDKRTN